MAEWLPIESAPKDGSAVLLYGGKGRYKTVIAKWDARWKAWQSEPGKWAVIPTHWMPLPAPPGTETGIPVHPTQLASPGIKGVAYIPEEGDVLGGASYGVRTNQARSVERQMEEAERQRRRQAGEE